jgi:glucokinase
MSGTTTSQDFALAIDIGGTKVDIAFVDLQGCLLSPVGKFAVPFDDHHRAIPKELLHIFEPYLKMSRDLPGKFRGIGLSLCGNVNRATGEAVLVPNLQWRNLPFSQMIVERFKTPVYAATDVRMAAVAELLWGAARGYRNFAWCTIGTGFGAFLFLDGKFFDGTHGFAGNIGHITLDEINGYPCGCGRKGCFETFTAGPAIARAGLRAAEQGKSVVLKKIAAERDITARDVFSASAKGDTEAMSILDEVVRLISINLGGLVNILDLDIIVMGGGVVNGSPDFVSRISRKIREHLMTEEAIRDLIIVKESFENSALIGAAADVFLREKILSI